MTDETLAEIQRLTEKVVKQSERIAELETLIEALVRNYATMDKNPGLIDLARKVLERGTK